MITERWTLLQDRRTRSARELLGLKSARLGYDRLLRRRSGALPIRERNTHEFW